MVTKGGKFQGGNGLGVWDQHMHTMVLGMQGPDEYRTGNSTQCNNLYGKKNLKKNGYVHMYN